MTFHLTDAQSKLVRSIEDNLDKFEETNPWSHNGLSDIYAEIVRAFHELEEEFPLIAAAVKTHLRSDSDSYGVDVQEGHENAVYGFFFSLNGLSTATTFSDLVLRIRETEDVLYEVVVFSKDWDWDEGCWKN